MFCQIQFLLVVHNLNFQLMYPFQKDTYPPTYKCPASTRLILLTIDCHWLPAVDYIMPSRLWEACNSIKINTVKIIQMVQMFFSSSSRLFLLCFNQRWKNKELFWPWDTVLMDFVEFFKNLNKFFLRSKNISFNCSNYWKWEAGSSGLFEFFFLFSIKI